MIDSLVRLLKRIGNDLAKGRNLEAYIATIAGIILIIVDLIGDVEQGLQLTIIIFTLTILVFRSTRPEDLVDLDKVLLDRQAYGRYSDFIAGARVLWVYGPSSINVLRDGSFKDVLERGGSVRFIIQNPRETHSMNQLKQQLDQEYNLSNDLDMSIDLLRRTKQKYPKLDYRLLNRSPGFSTSIVDPDGRNGHLVIEYFGYQNEAINSRMHIEIARTQTAFWFEYWQRQYELMWEGGLTDEQVFGNTGDSISGK